MYLFGTNGLKYFCKLFVSPSPHSLRLAGIYYCTNNKVFQFQIPSSFRPIPLCFHCLMNLEDIVKFYPIVVAQLQDRRLRPRTNSKWLSTKPRPRPISQDLAKKLEPGELNPFHPDCSKIFATVLKVWSSVFKFQDMSASCVRNSNLDLQEPSKYLNH